MMAAMGRTHDRMQGVKSQGMEGVDNSFQYSYFVCYVCVFVLGVFSYHG